MSIGLGPLYLPRSRSYHCLAATECQPVLWKEFRNEVICRFENDEKSVFRMLLNSVTLSPIHVTLIYIHDRDD